MIWFLGVLAVLVAGAIVIVAVGRGGGMRPVYDDRPDSTVPADSPLTGSALRSVRFSVGFRGYRMDEVDALLARLAEQLDGDEGPVDQSGATQRGPDQSGATRRRSDQSGATRRRPERLDEGGR